jgi:hypothetical protein
MVVLKRNRRSTIEGACGSIALSLAALLTLAGCSAGPRMEPPDIDPAKMSDEGFQAYLARTPLVTVDEAYRAMLILADGEDTSKSFDERREKLESRGIARAAWKLKPEDVIDSGSIAFMVCRICQIKGGVNMRLLGSWGLGDRRYAVRELQYREMIDEKVDYEYMTGPSLVGLLAKADQLMARKGLYESKKIDLSDETDRDEHGNLIVPPLPK